MMACSLSRQCLCICDHMDMPSAPCQCNAVVTGTAVADHALVCTKVAKLAQMRHDTLVEAVHLVNSQTSMQATL